MKKVGRSERTEKRRESDEASKTRLGGGGDEIDIDIYVSLSLSLWCHWCHLWLKGPKNVLYYRIFLGLFYNPAKDSFNCGTKSHVIPVSRTWDLLLIKQEENDEQQERRNPRNSQTSWQKKLMWRRRQKKKTTVVFPYRFYLADLWNNQILQKIFLLKKKIPPISVRLDSSD